MSLSLSNKKKKINKFSFILFVVFVHLTPANLDVMRYENNVCPYGYDLYVKAKWKNEKQQQRQRH